MPRRQSISLTPRNDDWLRAQVASEEFSSKSEVVNDLIRRAREAEMIRTKLIAAEQSGLSNLSAAELFAAIREEARQGGDVSNQ